MGDPAYDYRDLEFGRQDNKIYGPIDVVKKVYARGKEGLNFEQSITLVFEYEMKSYNGINQRQAFLDLISNILNVTYTTGTFWGGGYRIVGQPQNNLFTNLHIFRTKGEDGLNGYADALLKDIQDFLQNRDRIRLSDVDGDNWWQKAKNLLNSVAGMFVGGFLNNFGRPHKQFVQSILSPAPTGLWHLTIGNPRAPIMSMGNMIIKNTTIEHTGPLGIDEFPSGLKVTVELERGKPRDLRDIERMYMKGSDRIYISMGEKVLDMYKHAKEYKSSNTSNFVGDQNAQLPSSMPADTVIDASGNVVINDTHTSSMEDLQSEQSILLKYFGMSDQDAIIVTAKEQENGSQRIKSKSGAGDQGIGGGAMAI